MNIRNIGTKALAATIGFLVASGCSSKQANQTEDKVIHKAVADAIDVFNKRNAEFVKDSLVLSIHNPQLQEKLDSLDEENEFANSYLGELMMDARKTKHDLDSVAEIDPLGKKYQISRQKRREAEDELLKAQNKY